jgi:hypothetical protein
VWPPTSVLGAVRPPGIAVSLPAAYSGENPRGTQGAGSGVGMGAKLVASSYRKMSKSLVRQGEATKGKTASAKTCWEMTMLLVERSRHQ